MVSSYFVISATLFVRFFVRFCTERVDYGLLKSVLSSCKGSKYIDCAKLAGLLFFCTFAFIITKKKNNMRTRNANWFETSVQYERQGEDGLFTKVREMYVIDAFTFGEAEKAITQEMSSFSSGEFVI